MIKINTLILLIIGLMQMERETIIFDFNSNEKSTKWYIVNDDVMGGISKSDMVINKDGTATFKGNVSLENNGGFASVRFILDSIPQNRFKGAIVRFKGDGNIYNLRFRSNDNFDGYAYQAKVKTEKDTWKEFKISFDDFVPVYRGITLKDKPPLTSKDIAQMGILIADKQSGEFEVILDWVKFYD